MPSGRGDVILRRSGRQRRQVYQTLNQALLLSEAPTNGVEDNFYYGNSKGGRSMRSHSAGNPRLHATSSDDSRDQTTTKRPSNGRAASREVLALHTRDNPESETEEILDIYSRVKRRRRCATSDRGFYLEQSSVDLTPSAADEDVTVMSTRRKRDVQEKEPIAESSDSDAIVEGNIRQRYFLRTKKPTITRFEATLPEPKRRRLHSDMKEDDDSNESTVPGSAFQSPALRRRSPREYYVRKKLANHDCSSSSEESESQEGESEFKRNYKKNYKRGRSRFQPCNISKENAQTTRGRPRAGVTCADVDPMHIDSTIGFHSIGGLASHIHALQEMILLPFLYPEVFEKLQIVPPRGVIFYGAPGTGKTLLARALANECSKADRKVAFFMRKGADCLSKWVGESERQLRLLFDQAYSMRPSIIFFDEIDGLAPVRSSRQDQIHSSIVSTLLALMDGLDQRDEVIVIGATNRIDALDPALRRPGRFDRELCFSMPDVEARKQIIKINTKAWNPPLDTNLLEKVAERTVGFVGADLKGLCSEAGLIALRRRYPQIYTTQQRLLLDPTSIVVEDDDFLRALAKQTPCSQRLLSAPSRTCAPFLRPVITECFDHIISLIPRSFIRKRNCEFQVSDVKSVLEPLEIRPAVSGAKMLLCGNRPDCGQTKYYAPAVLHTVDHLPIFSLSVSNLYSSGRTPEEFITETLMTASRSGPCVVYLPGIDSWQKMVSLSAWHTLANVLDSLTAQVPLLILATVDCPETDIPAEVKMLFGHSKLFTVPSTYSAEKRRALFEPLLLVDACAPPARLSHNAYEVLPPAPPAPPRRLNENELKALRHEEESVMRQLRIFLREIAIRLVRDRKFAIFAKPVDPVQAPDYYEIVHQPMDLSMILSKLDQHKYETIKDFMRDIDLIRQNALEYNPDSDQTDKIIRHRACNLRDVAYALIDSEVDWTFEDRCQAIKAARHERGECGPVEPPPAYVYTVRTRSMMRSDPEDRFNNSLFDFSNEDSKYQNSQMRQNEKSPFKTAKAAQAAAIVKKYRKNVRGKRVLPLKRRKFISRQPKTTDAPDVAISSQETDVDVDEQPKSEKSDVTLPEPAVLEIDYDGLKKFLDKVIIYTQRFSLSQLDRLYMEMAEIVGRYSTVWDRTALISELKATIT